MNKPATLYLADDHPVMVEGLQLLIGDEDNIRIIGSAIDGLTAYSEIITLKPDIALVDLRMPGMTGLEILFKLQKTAPDTKLVILSMHGEPRNIRDAKNGGACGYLLKNSNKKQLMECLNKVMAGEYHFPDLVKSKHPDEKPLFSPREREIFRLVLEELTTAEIAERLNIASQTVSVHRKNIGQKIGTTSSLGWRRFQDEHQIEL